MPTPTSSTTVLRPDIAESFTEFDLARSMEGFIAQQVAPVIEVRSQAGTFGKIPLEQLLEERDTVRAPGSSYNRSNWQFEQATYATVEHGAEEPLDAREVAMYAEYFDAEMISALRARATVMRNAEKRWASAIFNTTTWTGASLTTGVTNEWDDPSNATPVADVEAAVQKIWDNSGLWANALIINRKVFRNLRLCDEITDKIASSGAGSSIAPGAVTVQQLAEVFDLPYIIVAGSPKNTAGKGNTASISPVWSDEYAMVCRVATSGDFKEPCIARTFHWSEDGSSIGGTVEQYEEAQTRSQIFRVRHDVDEVVLYPQAGHLLSNITT